MPVSLAFFAMTRPLPDRLPSISRRHFIGLGAAALSVSACASSGDGGDADVSGGGGQPVSQLPAGTNIVQRFPSTVLTTGPVRVPVSLADPDGTLATTGPDPLTAEFVHESGRVVAVATAQQRSVGEGTPLYWAFTPTLDDVGIYDIRMGELTAAIQLFEPGSVVVPSPGGSLPGFDTPTVADPRGVDPICSRLDGPCPFHDLTLTDALARKQPLIYVIGTPAHCSTGTCAPGLEFIIAEAAEAPDVVVVHADVYTDDTATVITDAVNALSLTYEPVVFGVAADGTVVQRLDAIWDSGEIRDMIAAIR
jgi:hypothetical protein